MNIPPLVPAPTKVPYLLFRYAQFMFFEQITYFVVPALLIHGEFIAIFLMIPDLVLFIFRDKDKTVSLKKDRTMNFSPTILLFHHLPWVRIWVLRGVSLGVLVGITWRFFPESIFFYGTLAVAAAHIIHIMFEIDRRKLSVIMYGTTQADECDPDLIIDRTNINIGTSGSWNPSNDELIAALRLSNTHPAEAVLKIHKIADNGININARDDEGWTALDHAQYIPCSPMFISLLKFMGGIERKMDRPITFKK